VNTPKEVYVLDTNLRKIFKYNLQTGEYINSIAVRYPDYHCLHIQYYKERLYTDVKFHKRTPDSYLLQEIDKATGKQKEHWLSVDEYNCGLVSIDSNRPCFFSGELGTPKFSDQYMTKLFSLDKDNVNLYLKLESKNLITKDYIDKTFGEKSFIELTLDPKFRSLKKVRDIREFFETEDFIVFSFIQERHLRRHVFYNKTDKQIQIGKPLDNLLFGDNSYGIYNLSTQFMAADANGLYRSVRNIKETSFFDVIQKGYIRKSIDQYDRLMELTEDSNPIIMYYEYKKAN